MSTDHDARRWGVTRRGFLGSVAAAGALATGSTEAQAQEQKPAQPKRPSEDDVHTNIETVRNIARTESSMPGKFPGVVTEVFHPAAVAGTKPDAAIAAAMLAEAMKSLTGKEDHAEAWKLFFSPEDRIGIKLNPIGGKLLSNTHELTGAIIAALEGIGVPKSNIVIWDRREEQLAEAGYTPDRYPGHTIIGTEYMVKEGEQEVWKGEDRLDKNVFYEFDIVGEYDAETMPYMLNGGTKSYFTRIITEMVDKVINVPVLKNAGPGITLCLKNMAFGVTSNTARGHRIWNRFNAEVCAFPQVRDKVVLNIIDGLRACYEGGPGAVARYIWNANTIYAATDPVACDRIAWEKIFAKRVAEGIAITDDWEPGIARYNKLSRAEALGLGTCQRDRIDYRRVKLGDEKKA